MDSLKQREEQKRNLACDPAERWRQIQRMIAWAEANLPPHLRRNRPRTAKKTASNQSIAPSFPAAELDAAPSEPAGAVAAATGLSSGGHRPRPHKNGAR